MEKRCQEVTPYLPQGFLEAEGTQGVGQLPREWQSYMCQLDTAAYYVPRGMHRWAR